MKADDRSKIECAIERLETAETKKRLESEAKSIGLGLAPYVRMLITRAFLTKPKVPHEKE